MNGFWWTVWMGAMPLITGAVLGGIAVLLGMTLRRRDGE